DLGFYDLRLPEARQAQADLAREYGVYGFCYYHYWFNGRRLLERPVNEIQASGEPDFPFCVCWANENWTRCWDGRDKEMLLEQVYSPKDDLDHIRSLIPLFKEPRYIKVDGKPFFLVYRMGRLPEPEQTIRLWREEIVKAGLPGLYLANIESHPLDHGIAGRLALDAAVEFAPDWNCLAPPIRPGAGGLSFFKKKDGWANHRVSDYRLLMEAMRQKPRTDYLRYRCVTPMWDNAARRAENAVILINSTPELYGRWLAETVKEFDPPSQSENFIFINAWNEWAEGCHLEPCRKFGRAYLEATRDALVSQPLTVSK
ncbi:MAG TPA: glycoside hydrolase family 99-like domain-containing protein, partial [Verrucomicrobiae bacterium]